MAVATLSALIPRLRSLLATGFAPDADGALSGLRCLAHPLANGSPHGWVVSQRLLAVRTHLANDNELVCAFMAQRPEVKRVWLAVAAARCKEAGQMADAAPLVDLVSALQTAAAWVEAALPHAQLSASPQAALERELLGVSFEQAAATPALMRILAVAASLARHEVALPALPLLDARGNEAQQNWVTGRLLALPETLEAKSAIAAHVLLHGGFAIEQGAANQTSMSWVLANPWPLLLAMLVYAQDTWKAESRGGLLLELKAGQNTFRPSEISLVVVGPEGDEIPCGSLADLLLKSLDYLGVSCFPRRPTSAELNAQLSPLVGLLLDRQVWRYQDGASGQHGQYQIHPLFADACFRLPGSKVFNRTGRLLWQAVRISAEALYHEHRRVRRDERFADFQRREGELL